jgi:hypothetical protein
MPWGAIGQIGGALIGGLFASQGQKDANAMNIQLARENRNWQERMSNTAYQRAAHDLDKAGLNRIMAFGSPATTPGGNVATVGNVGAAGVDGAVSAAGTALAAKRLKQEIKNMKAVEKKDLELAGQAAATGRLAVRQAGKTALESRQLIESILLLNKQQPGAQAESDFWKKLNSGELGSSAKGLIQFAPLLRILRGK